MKAEQIRARLRELEACYRAGTTIFREYAAKKDVAFDYCKRVHEEIIELKKQLPNYKPRIKTDVDKANDDK